MNAEPAPTPDKTENSDGESRPVTTFAELRDIADRAHAGDETVLPQVRRLLQEHAESAIAIVQADPERNTERMLLREITAGNRPREEAMRRHVELLRESLSGPQPSPVEALLVDRIVVCWLQVQQCDYACSATAGLTQQWTSHREKVRDRAHRRLLSAIKMLSTVRRLAHPAIQFNFAHQQINTA